MAGEFGAWVRTWREEAGLSEAELARRLRQRLSRYFGRDWIWKLERGSPANPDAEIVTALAALLRRPLVDALGALGYELPANYDDRIIPALANLLGTMPWDLQERMATALPALLALAQGLVAAPTSPATPPALPPAATEDPTVAWVNAELQGMFAGMPVDEQVRAVEWMKRNYAADLRRRHSPDLEAPITKTGVA